MKKEFKHILTILLAVAALCSGCQKELEEEIAVLKERVKILEEEVYALNKTYQSISDIADAIERNDLISAVEKLEDGSYRISFSSGKVVTLRNGKDGLTPIMGIQKADDVYYWTVQMGERGEVKWLYDSKGLRIRASAIVPKVKVEETGGKDYWYYSFDEESWHLLEGSGETAHGYSGSAVFNSVECSDDGIVTITLADGVNVFQIPTQSMFDGLNAMCDTINSNMKIVGELIDGVDTTVFVKSVTEIVEGGKIVGYDVVFADGRAFPLRSGRDTSSVKVLSIGWNSQWSYYWKIGDEPVRYKGEVVSAAPQNVVPVLRAVAVNGKFYFTIAVGDGEVEFLLDSEGNPVLASPIRFFEKIEEKNGTIELTLTEKDSEGAERKVSLVRMEDCTPYLHLSSSSDWKILKEEGTGSFTAGIDSLGINEKEEFIYELEAVAVNGVTDVTVGQGSDLTPVDGSAKKSISHQVSFSLKENVAVGDTVSIAVFLSWGNRTIMKVGQLKVE